MPYQQHLPPLICFQNGVENEARLAALLGTERVIAGTVTSSVARRAAGDIIVERQRGLGLSSLHPIICQICPGLQPCRIECPFISSSSRYEMVKDADQPGWKCHLSNSRPHPGTGVCPSHSFSDWKFRQLREALAVMRAFGYPGGKFTRCAGAFVRVGCQALSILDRPPITAARRRDGDVAQKCHHFHIDLHSGRGQSEVDYLERRRGACRTSVPGCPRRSMPCLNRNLAGSDLRQPSHGRFSPQSTSACWR